MTDPRLRNWGRYVWVELMRDRPDGSCVNSIYSMGGNPDMEAFGIIDGNTVLAPQIDPAIAEQEDIDYEDAESLDMLIGQIDRSHRIVLHRVYVLRGRKGSPAILDAAIKAVDALRVENARVNAVMRGRY